MRCDVLSLESAPYPTGRGVRAPAIRGGTARLGVDDLLRTSERYGGSRFKDTPPRITWAISFLVFLTPQRTHSSWLSSQRQKAFNRLIPNPQINSNASLTWGFLM